MHNSFNFLEVTWNHRNKTYYWNFESKKKNFYAAVKKCKQLKNGNWNLSNFNYQHPTNESLLVKIKYHILSKTFIFSHML